MPEGVEKMSLLILLSIPAIAGIIGMAIAFTSQVLYPRLAGRADGEIRVPAQIAHPHRRRAA